MTGVSTDCHASRTERITPTCPARSRYGAVIVARHLPAAELIDLLRSPLAADELGGASGGALVVDATGADVPDDPALAAALSGVPVVIVGVVARDAQPGVAALADVVVAQDDPSFDPLLSTIAAHPHAATTLAVLLRRPPPADLGVGLAAESAAYSTLQGGPEFSAWRACRPVRARPPEPDPPVRCSRDGSRLHVALSRPAVHNAFNAAMRDALIDAFALGTDLTIDAIELTGDGPSFCSGGDLDEFGSFPDPATAHLVRLTRSAGRSIARVADRVVARLHGACVGSGIELPAFAGRVVAAPDTRIALPEVGMGLIPGAGGTVSLTRRIGRHRTAWLALSGATIGPEVARAWGLVDELAPRASA